MALSRYAENGVFAPAKIAGVLRTTRDEIAETVGLVARVIQTGGTAFSI